MTASAAAPACGNGWRQRAGQREDMDARSESRRSDGPPRGNRGERTGRGMAHACALCAPPCECVRRCGTHCWRMIDLTGQSDCLSPGAVSPDEITAYTRGEADAAVGAHIERCPACRAEAAAQARIDRLLSAALFRYSCPPTLAIGEYAQ